MLKKIFVKIILGRRKRVFEFVRIRGINYKLSIEPYEPADIFIERMKKALQEQGHAD